MENSPLVWWSSVFWFSSSVYQLPLTCQSPQVLHVFYQLLYLHTVKEVRLGFPGGWDSKASAHNVGDPGSIPESGRSPGEGSGTPLQYSCLENSMDGGAWWATVHGVAKSRTWLSDFSLHFHFQRGKAGVLNPSCLELELHISLNIIIYKRNPAFW